MSGLDGAIPLGETQRGRICSGRVLHHLLFARDGKGEDEGGESGADKAVPSQFPASTGGEEIAPACDTSEVKDLRSQIYVHLFLNNLSFHSFFP